MPDRIGFQQYYKELVRALVRLTEEKDAFIKGHSERVAGYCRQFFKKLGLPKREIDRVYLAGLLHDVGMVYLPLELIQKPDKLTDDERKMIQTHPVVAEKILSNASILRGILPLIRHHHECVDGSGYPDGLQGDSIPLGARLIAIMDSFCAMTADRPWRKAMGVDEALEEIKQAAGTLHDATLVKGLVQLVKPEEAPDGTAPSAEGAEPAEEGVGAAINNVISQFKRGQIELPVLPNVVHEVQKVIKNPMATTEALAKVIEQDSVISIKLISTSNSSMYRGTKKINTVAEAVPRLGLKQTQSIVSAIANKALYKTKNEAYNDLMARLWSHSLATAYCARAIAKQLRLEDIEKFFLLGLIHDIGKVLLVKALTDLSSSAKSAEAEYSVEQIVESMQGVHNSFGGALLERWQFDGTFAAVARNHDNSKFADGTPPEVLVAHLANILTRNIAYSLREAEEVDLAELESVKRLGIDPATLEPIAAEVKTIMQKSDKAFN